jgi:phosphohistidine phosphatase
MVANASRYRGPLELMPELYAAGPEVYIDLLGSLDEGSNSVMVVGHNPGLEQLLQTLTGTEESLPTAALAKVELEIDAWSELDRSRQGSLVRLWRPKELDKG